MIYVVLLVVGLCLGSFVNAFVYRLFENDKDTYFETKKIKLKNKPKSKLSIWNGRSICVHCNHQLSWLDLVPVLSWAYLKGKCRYCNKYISWQYPLVEVATAFLFILSYIYWPLEFNNYQIGLFIFWCIFLVEFMALCVFDLRWYLLPNKIVFGLYILFLLQIIYMLVAKSITLSQFIGIVFGGLTVGILFWILHIVSKGEWIGGGDVKLGFLLGALGGGFTKSLLIIFLASLLGSLVGGIYLYIAKRFKLKAQLPFGPYLLVSTVVTVLFGSKIIDQYINIISR